jgi:hypothetical protein
MRDIAVKGTRGVSEGTSPRDEEQGFRASLSGAALPDLVQMECLALTEGSFRVISGGQVGYLFFQRGQLTHALVDDLSGEEAALEILEWQRGTFEPCRVAWPEQPTITSTWQNLLITSAREKDESGRRRLAAVPNHAEPRGASMSERPSGPPPKPARGSPGPVSVARPASTPPLSRDTQPSQLREEPAPSAPPSGGGVGQAFVRLDRDGNVIASRGEALGMTQFTALESTHAAGRHVIHLDPEGGVVALRAPLSADLSAIRKKFDL